MSDTPHKTERLYERMLLEKSGAERVEMALGMLAAARLMAQESLQSADPAVRRERLFLRLYGRDFGPAERERIAAALHRGRPD